MNTGVLNYSHTALLLRPVRPTGAKNHLVAMPDCDVGMASRDVLTSFAGCSGQRCMSASVLVLVGDGSALLERVVALAGTLRPGQAAGQVGPLIDAPAKARVRAYIDQAEAAGARVLVDGRGEDWSARPGYWIGPTILLHSEYTPGTPLPRACTDEIFGPVLSVVQVDTREQALAIENSSQFGNAACIYTERGADAEWFVSHFKAAMLGVNVGIPVPREPFSFGGMYGTQSKYGDSRDITGDGAMDFFSNRVKVTSKWGASYASSTAAAASTGVSTLVSSPGAGGEDKAQFDGAM